MSALFTETANCSVNNTIHSNFLKTLPDVIRKHADWDYSCQETDTGCFLKPTFRHMPYRNSFVPEIDVVVSHNNAQIVLHMSGQPVKSVRVFMAIWFGFALMMEVFLLALAITSNLDGLFPVFIPIILCVFGYLLCKIATGATFKSVMKVIQKELK